MEKRIIGDCELYCGNSKDLMDIKANLIVTDPPYKLTSGGKNTGKMGGIFKVGKYNNDGNIANCELSWDNISEICNRFIEVGHVYVMSDSKNLSDMLNAFNSRFKFHNMLYWKKNNVTPNRWYMKDTEFTGFFYKGKSKYINKMGSKQSFEFPNITDKIHPTEKPVELMEHYILNSSKVGEVVLDPFMGAGASAIASIQNGRKFIGIEINEYYFDIACTRIENFYKVGKDGR